MTPTPRATWLALSALTVALSFLVAVTCHRQLWFIDEEIYLGHGTRALQEGGFRGYQVDLWNPPLSYLVHGVLLPLHPGTPDLHGPPVQDPELPSGRAPEVGKKNPVLRDSATPEIVEALGARGDRFDRYVLLARLPMLLLAPLWLLALASVLRVGGATPWPGVLALAVSHVFVITNTRILADGVAAGLSLAALAVTIAFARQPGAWRGAASGAVAGLSLAAKLSSVPALAALPVAILALARRPWSKRALAIGIAAAAFAAFFALWGSSLFQVGSIDGMDPRVRPHAPTWALRLQRPELTALTLPMPMLPLTLATNRDVVAGSAHIKIDGTARVPPGRKLAHFASRTLAHGGWALVPLALLALVQLARDARTRALALALAAWPAFHLASAWAADLELSSRRAIPLTIAAALLAGMAWREGASPFERRVRGPLLLAHVAIAAVQLALFLASPEAPAPVDSIMGWH